MRIRELNMALLFFFVKSVKTLAQFIFIYYFCGVKIGKYKQKESLKIFVQTIAYFKYISYLCSEQNKIYKYENNT